ncbi:MAG: hydantoinase B/oxoprolinase family protein [Alphaproteobacteria bacterium]|nr:hydantoinase B/oxoprolinase family protein [Alphaproteobacteria bacterium]
MSDFITSAVIRESLASVVREMRRSMVRSSYSSIIYEGYDFSCAIMDARGQLVAQSGEDHPFHVIPVAWSVGKLLETGVDVRDEDVFLHNDPYSGGTHLNDVAVIWPVFEDGRLLMFVVIRSHWADIGGMTPGSLSGKAREILQEGLRLNHVRVPKTGRSEVMDVIFANVRINDEALADFRAVLGTCRVAEARLKELLRKYSTGTVLAAIDELLRASEERMRSAIRDLPDGRYVGTGYLDGNEPALFPLRVQVALTLEGDGLRADFDGTSAQVPAPLNAGPAIAATSVLTIVKSFLDPAGVINSGTIRAIEVEAPAGTILHATYPAPCGGLNEVRFAADGAVMAALAQIIPERITGDVRGTSNHTYIGGVDPARGKPFIFYEYPSGGTGAFDGSDGNHAVRAFNEGENVSIQSAEVVETIYPLRIRRNELRPDSGGPGRFRGGCGLLREVEVLADGARLSVLSDRNLIPPFGVNGGRSGAPNRYEIQRNGETIEPSAFPGKVADFPLQRGDVVRMMSSGGGGYGAAPARDPERLTRDFEDGVVTEAGLEPYGAELTNGTLAMNGWPTDETSARVVLSNEKAPVHACRVSAALAQRLALSEGQMVELVRAHGPAMRFWVADTEPGVEPSIALSSIWRGALEEEICVVRATPTRMPNMGAQQDE